MALTTNTTDSLLFEVSESVSNPTASTSCFGPAAISVFIGQKINFDSIRLKKIFYRFDKIFLTEQRDYQLISLIRKSKFNNHITSLEKNQSNITNSELCFCIHPQGTRCCSYSFCVSPWTER